MIRWLRQTFCRHMDSEILLNMDGPAPGWEWRCFTCKKVNKLK